MGFIVNAVPLLTKREAIFNTMHFAKFECEEIRDYILKVCQTTSKKCSIFRFLTSKSFDFLIHKPLLKPSEFIISLHLIRFSGSNYKKKLNEVVKYCVLNLSQIFTPSEVSIALEKLIQLKPFPFHLINSMMLLTFSSDIAYSYKNHTIKWIKY